MDWLKARSLFETVMTTVDGTPHLERLVHEWQEQAVRYAQVRTRSAMVSPEDRKRLDLHRGLTHTAFIDSTNALSRAMQKQEMDIGWRAELGHNRRVIGDFACYVHCLLGLRGA